MDNGEILAEIIIGGELNIHLIGVAGSGMSGIAGLLLGLGHRVSGSDKVRTVEIERLEKKRPSFSSGPGCGVSFGGRSRDFLFGHPAR